MAIDLHHLHHLRTFVAIANAGGVARAAVRLNMSQPAASRQIQALEAALGLQLFDRIGRRVQLTSEGEDLLRRCRRLLAEVDSLGERARELKSGQTGVLRVGSPPQTIESLLVGFVREYQRRHPGVEVNFTADGALNLALRLQRGELHLTVAPETGDGFHRRSLYPVYLLAVLSKDHRLAGRAVIDVTELADERLLVPGLGFISREWFYAACEVAHIKPHVVFETTAPQTLIALAADRHGVGVIPPGVLITRDDVRVVPLVQQGAAIGRWQIVAWDPQRFLAPYARHFIEELVAFTRHEYPNCHLTRGAPPMPQPKDVLDDPPEGLGKRDRPPKLQSRGSPGRRRQHDRL